MQFVMRNDKKIPCDFAGDFFVPSKTVNGTKSSNLEKRSFVMACFKTASGM